MKYHVCTMVPGEQYSTDILVAPPSIGDDDSPKFGLYTHFGTKETQKIRTRDLLMNSHWTCKMRSAMSQL